MLKIARGEIHLEEVKADDWENSQIQALIIDKLTEEFANLDKVEHGYRSRLCLARSVAPSEKFVKVALDE